MISDFGYRLGIVGNSQKAANPGNLAGQIGLQIGEMHDQHIRQIAQRPPLAHVFPKRPERLAILRQPIAEVLAHIRVRLADGRTHKAGATV